MPEHPLTFSCWPRLLDVSVAARYLSVGPQTVRDWVMDGLLQPVRMPGSALRDKHGNLVTKPSRREIGKILLAKEDLDRFIDGRKKQS